MKRIFLFSLYVFSVIASSAQVDLSKEESPQATSRAGAAAAAAGDFIPGKKNPTTKVKDQAKTNLVLMI